MNKKVSRILEIGCSGIIGVVLTLGVQRFFPQQQEFTFVINGKTVALTEPQLQERFDSTQEELNTTKEELEVLREQTSNASIIDYSDFALNINGELRNEYKNGYAVIDGKKYIIFNVLNDITDEDIEYKDNILYIGHSSTEIVDLMDACPPYDVSEEFIYSTEAFEMEGKLYNNGFSMRNYRDEYVVINLDSRFSNLEFDFGHVDGSNSTNCTLKVYLDEKLIKTIEKTSDAMITHESIELNYAKQLKLQFISSNDNGIYGLGNIKLQY